MGVKFGKQPKAQWLLELKLGFQTEGEAHAAMEAIMQSVSGFVKGGGQG